MIRGPQPLTAGSPGKPVLEPYDGRSLSILLLCDDNPRHAGTVLDHIAQFTHCSQHRVFKYNPCGSHSWLLDLSEFDVVVIHYSLVITLDQYLPPSLREKIRQFAGLKIQIIQDDYRWIEQITAMQRHLGIHVLYTLVPPEAHEQVWCARVPGLTTVHTLPGHVPDSLLGLESPPLAARTVDIGYRGRYLGYWLGELAQEKRWIAEGVSQRAPRYGLRCDISCSEQSRIYGADWMKFLGNCRANLGTEGGVSITDFDGSIERQVHAYMREHPRADFFEVQREVLMPYENNVRLAMITTRMFEAAAMRTPLVLFPGPYSNILLPWQHYIPLEKDFSNFGEVADRLRDLSFLEQITTRTYDDLLASGEYSQRTFVAEFDRVVTTFSKQHQPTRVASRVRKQNRPRYGLSKVMQRCLDKPMRLAGNVGRGLAIIAIILANATSRSLLAAWLLHDANFTLSRAKGAVRELVRIGVLERRRKRGPAANRWRMGAHLHWNGRILQLTSLAPSLSYDRPSRSGRPTPTLDQLNPETMIWDHHAVGDKLEVGLPRNGRMDFDMGPDGQFSLITIQRMLSEEIRRQRRGPVSRWLQSLLDDAEWSQSGEPPKAAPPTATTPRFPEFHWRTWRRVGAAVVAVLAAEPIRAILAARLCDRAARQNACTLVFDELSRLAILERKLSQRAEDDGFELSVRYDRSARLLRLVSHPNDGYSSDLDPPGDVIHSLGAIDPLQIVWNHAAVGSHLVSRTRAGYVRFAMGVQGELPLIALNNMLGAERRRGQPGPVSRWLDSLIRRCSTATVDQQMIPNPVPIVEPRELRNFARSSA